MGWTFYNSSGEAMIEDGAAIAATQAEMEAASSTDDSVFVTPGRTHNHPGVAKVWCQWEQTGAHSITGSYNMTSVADGGSAGNTDHLFATDFSNTSYAIVGFSPDTSYMEHGGVSLVAGGITTVTIHPQTGSGADKNWNHIVVFGDQ
jgi:hypothetical protein